MIRVLHLSGESDRSAVEEIIGRLRLDPAQLALHQGSLGRAAAAVAEIVADVAARGDAAVVDACRRFDDPQFTADQLRVSRAEMEQARARVPAEQLAAIRHAIRQVREYQRHIMPADPPALRRAGAELGLRFTPLDSAGLYFPGGRAAYPSSLIMLAVPAQVAGVRRIVVCTPPSRYGRSDLVLAACAELELEHVYRAGGAAAVAAMALGTEAIPRVDKIFGPGNVYVQLAKRLVAGAVGTDGFLGPSEIVIIADETGRPDFIAADMLAQAEHDPGSAFLLTTSGTIARQTAAEIARQLSLRQRAEAIEKALRESCAIIVGESMDALVELANRFAAEHVSIQVRRSEEVLSMLRHGGAIFVGPYAAVAAGDYVAGPSHCLPTGTTARFASGVSVYEFLKRSSVERYTREGLEADAAAIIALARAEGLDAHAASVEIRCGAAQ